ncbi:MAG: hypothetical protein A4S09_12285 [Proteobacteria bacterium SG_bin7]|nr:MAG: hypothetical protein A4S09_12285 [Proteobacteria bacterium SG_bin7]
MKTNIKIIRLGVFTVFTSLPYLGVAGSMDCSRLFSPPKPEMKIITNPKASDYSRSKKYAVQTVYIPETEGDLQSILRQTNLPISIKGGGFSMGGQTIAEKGIVIDMSKLNRITKYDPQQKVISVQGGATWRQIQETIDKDNLAIKVMQSYNNFSVAGSLGVNVHGRYVGYRPIISTVKEIRIMLSSGEIKTANRSENSDLFFGAIGGYGALGIILEATLDLSPNRKIERFVREFKGSSLAQTTREYLEHFTKDVENNPGAVMTNADLYPPKYNTIRSSTYVDSHKPLTIDERIQPRITSSRFVSELMASMEQLYNKVKLFRAAVHAPHELSEEKVVLQNWEASYDANGLMSLNDKYPILRTLFPFSNRKSLLQEYFIPRDQLPTFIEKMKSIFQEFDVNVTNVSIRHVPKNTESVLSWSKEEGFALVIYYTQTYGFRPNKHLAKAKLWTQKMLNEVINSGGTFYLPYQVYASREQFEKAYPRHKEFYSLKRKFDPQGRFTNNMWQAYGEQIPTQYYTEVMNSPANRQKLKDFFAHIFNVREPDQFISAIDKALTNLKSRNQTPIDQNIYEELAKVLPETAPGVFQTAAKTISSLKTQQNEMANETLELMKGDVGNIDGYVEIGTKGRYVQYLKNLLGLKGIAYVVTDAKPSLFSVPDILERTGGYGATDYRSYLPALLRAKFVNMNNYDMISQAQIPNESVDLVTMYIGLHHIPLEKLRTFVSSIYRILRPGGKFILRDHDATSDMQPIVHLAHSTYNAGLGIPFAEEKIEVRNFQPVAYWKNLLKDSGLVDLNRTVLQEGDPTLNTLMIFEKPKDGKAKKDIADPETLSSMPNYHRAQSQTYMTQPEWFLVDIFTEFAAFMKHTPWYEFPFQKFIDLYDNVYKTHRNFALNEGIVDKTAFEEYDQMDHQLFIGIKILFKAMAFAANQVKSGLRDQTVDLHTHFIADIDTKSLAELPEGLVEEVKELQDNLKHIQTERYMPFTEAIIQMAKKGATIREVAGNKFITVLVSSAEQSPPKIQNITISSIMSYQYPTASFQKGTKRYFHSLRLPVSQLTKFVNAVDGTQNQILRIHDF